jgi:hypothetical protein
MSRLWGVIWRGLLLLLLIPLNVVVVRGMADLVRDEWIPDLPELSWGTAFKLGLVLYLMHAVAVNVVLFVVRRRAFVYEEDEEEESGEEDESVRHAEDRLPQ